MGVRNFRVKFDSPTDTYNVGTNVTGRLLFSVDNSIKIKAIVIQFLGVAKTFWTETKTESVRQPDGTMRDDDKKTSFKGREELFSNKFKLAGEIRIPPGDHVYPFSCTLPDILPSSFESKHGNIRYKVEATLNYPGSSDVNAGQVFTVLSPIDLNFNSKAKRPANLELEKWFCCCWCKSGPLTVVINLPYSGFVPNQEIPVTLELDNASNVRVDKVVLKLEKLVEWKAHIPHKKHKEDTFEIEKLTLGGVEANGSKTYTQALVVPIMPSSNLDGCSLMDCSYTLQVTAEVSGCHINPTGEIPIFLGTVPLRGTHGKAPPPPRASEFVPSAPPCFDGPQPTLGFNVHPGLMDTHKFPVLSPIPGVHLPEPKLQ